MQQVCRPLSILCLLFFALSESQATSDKSQLHEQKSSAKWSLLQSAAGSPPRDSDQRPAALQATSPTVTRCFSPTAIVANRLELNSSSSLVASMFLKVAADGGWIADFDEDFWMSKPTQPGTQQQARTFFSLKFNDFTIEARLTQTSELEVELPSGTYTPLTYFPVDKWLKLVLELGFDGKINVEIGGGVHVNSYPAFGKSTSSAEERLDEEQQESQTELPSQMKTGESVDGVASNKSHVIQVEVCHIDAPTDDKPWLYVSRLEAALVSEFDISMKCEAQLNGTYTFYKQSGSDSDTLSTLCKDRFSLIVLPSTISYFDHDEQCRKFQGTVLSNDDVRVYEKELSKISSGASSKTDENLSWVQSLNDTSESFKSWCSVLLKNVTLNMRPCYSSLPSSICKVQTSLPFHLFGRVHKFARNYTLITKPDGTWAIKGFSSLMRYNATEWIMFSNLHEEVCRSDDSILPLVRSSWQCGEVSNLTLAFSSCDPNSFSCNSGQCLPRSSRCDGISQCDDETDEEMCDFIVKDAGYSNLVVPPPSEGDKHLKVNYFFLVHSIAPVQTKDFYAEVDLVFGVHWKDLRLTIWNPINDKALNCKEIWHPSYSAADGHPQGHWVSMPDKTSDGCMIALLPHVARKESIDDPYMGRYLNGSSFELVYRLSGIFKIPCQFDLRKYPFGDQRCELNIWIDNTNHDYSIYQRYDDDPDDIPFYGFRDVREYRVSRTRRKEINRSRSVSLFIEFKSLYGYHVLNSYLTSFLILLISFSTAVFRVEDFNERVMVSLTALTALLVLTALFTQANSSSIQTPYVKLLDVWYAALIAFSFLTVLANTLLNSYYHKLDADKKLGKKCYDETTIIEKVKILNCVLFGSLVAVFLVFMFFYVLSAANKI